NPLVGALIVKNQQVIGQGCHRRYGGPHAEIEAINDCQNKGHDPAGATMFVTLEPCCHYGKTPPCTDAIIKAQIAKVEIATLDDFAEVAGQGANQLKNHGIEVIIGCCEKAARRVNAGFFKRLRTEQPHIILKWAQSADGKLAWPKDSKNRWITGLDARHHAHQLRSRCGAILVGIDTVLSDDPLLTVRLQGEHFQPVRVILDSHLRTPQDCKIVKTARDAPVMIYTLGDDSNKYKYFLKMGCKVITVEPSGGYVSLTTVITDLGDRGVNDLLVEGGAKVLKSFWEQGLADQVAIYKASEIIGNDTVPKIEFDVGETKLTDISVLTFEKDKFIS
ncbi:MAG: bifunctional diaminohydroxyphosphoribosylaminopyrimidine deaminase/5-amino-6-(5-phosphoribosylamino)uracil reductase RibD, partial [Planctomycetes bacterium]|nr:bifunctional diaminohydroxyphosphoribosylaminopyrimidine deaminase/5-amino-6-(5-phosphoribosylamino)uracil reductase RibD [Planctomycetota bacterium]